jgi:CDP-diacylglycerol--serine O-phosphatidyltransferase
VQIGVIVFAFPDPPAERWQQVAVLALVVVLAFLMVSTFRYHSFKGVDLRRRRSYMTVLGIALLFFLVATHPQATLLTVVSLYTVSGPLAWGIAALRRHREVSPPGVPVPPVS